MLRLASTRGAPVYAVMHNGARGENLFQPEQELLLLPEGETGNTTVWQGIKMIWKNPGVMVTIDAVSC